MICVTIFGLLNKCHNWDWTERTTQALTDVYSHYPQNFSSPKLFSDRYWSRFCHMTWWKISWLSAELYVTLHASANPDQSRTLLKRNLVDIVNICSSGVCFIFMFYNIFIYVISFSELKLITWNYESSDPRVIGCHDLD